MKRPSRKSLPRRAKRARFASDTSALYIDLLPVDVVAMVVSFIVGGPRVLSRPKCKLLPKPKAAATPVAHKGQPAQPAPPQAPQVQPQPQGPQVPVAVVAAAAAIAEAANAPLSSSRPLRTGCRREEALGAMVELINTNNDMLKLACSMNFVSVVETDVNIRFFGSSTASTSTECVNEGEVLLSTSGAKQYKHLNTVMKSLGKYVRTLKFEDKHITKRYAQIVRRFCPHLTMLKLSFGDMFAAWRVSALKMGAQLEEMLAGIVPLDTLELEISECSQFHIDAIGKFASGIKHIVLKINTDSERNDLAIKSLMPIYAAVADGEGSILKKLEIHVHEKFSESDALKLQSIHILCPKVEVTVNEKKIVADTNDQ